VRKIAVFAIAVLLAAALGSAQSIRADEGGPPPPELGSGSEEGGFGAAPGAPPPDLPTDGDPGDDPSAPPETPPSDPPAEGGGSTTPVPPETPAAAKPVATASPAAAPQPPPYCVATPTADIGVTARTDQPHYVVGSTVNYSLDVYVVKEGRTYCSALDARLTFKVPPQLELISSNAVNAPEGARCEVTGGVGSQLVTCYFGSIGAGEHAAVSVSAKADTAGSATAEAGVSTTDADPDTSDQQYVVSVAITPNAPASTSAKQPASPAAETARPVQSSHPTAIPTHLKLPGSHPRKKPAGNQLVLPG
jgi:hypothetical protein